MPFYLMRYNVIVAVYPWNDVARGGAVGWG